MMVKRYFEITENCYKNLVNMKDKQYADKIMREEAPVEYRCGYGIYGARPVEKEGKFYVEYITGSTCD